MDLKPVKQTLERVSCPTHGQHPSVTVSGDSLKIECCCEAFKAEIVRKSEKLISDLAKKDIEDKLKNMFK